MKKRKEVFIRCSSECNRMKGSSRCEKKIESGRCLGLEVSRKDEKFQRYMILKDNIIPLVV